MKEETHHLKKDYQSLVKHNKLIKSRYTLTVIEQKLLYKIFETIQKNNYKSRELNLEFEEFFIEFKSVYKKNITKKDFKNLLEGLQVKMPYILKGNEFIRTQWYKIKGDISYEKVTLILDKDIFEYIQAQEKNYTMLRLESVYSFLGMYTFKIYELIKQWCNTKRTLEFSLEDFKLALDIVNNKGYAGFYNIKKRILEPSIEEINEKSELKIDFDVVKKGRNVIKIIFIILENKSLKKNNDIINDDIINDDIIYKNQLTNNNEINSNELSDYNYSNDEQLIYNNEVSNSFEESPRSIGSNNSLINDELKTNNIIERNDNVNIKTEVKTSIITIPEDTVLTAGALRLLKVHFKGYDFTVGINYEAYLEAEALTLDRDNVDEIGSKQYGFFRQTLKNKLETMEIQLEKEKEYAETRDVMFELYKDDDDN